MVSYLSPLIASYPLPQRIWPSSYQNRDGELPLEIGAVGVSGKLVEASVLVGGGQPIISSVKKRMWLLAAKLEMELKI